MVSSTAVAVVVVAVAAAGVDDEDGVQWRRRGGHSIRWQGTMVMVVGATDRQ